jgi:hypothetical protein
MHPTRSHTVTDARSMPRARPAVRADAEPAASANRGAVRQLSGLEGAPAGALA